MSDLDDDRLAELIRSADRPRSTTAAERARLRRALDSALDDRSPQPSSVAAADWVQLRDPSRTSRRPRRLAVVGAAATVLAVLVVLGWYRVRPADAPATTLPLPASAPAVREICADEIAQLDAAVGEWGTVEDWSASTDGTPDLAVLTESALRAIGSVGAVDGAVAVSAERVAAVVAEREAFELPPGPVLAEHALVVREGLLVVVEAVARLDPDTVCDVSAIRESLTG